MSDMKIPPAQRSAWLANTIRAVAMSRGLDQRRLAARLGWGEAMLSRKLSGARTMKVAELEAIADALDVPAGELLNGWHGMVPVPDMADLPKPREARQPRSQGGQSSSSWKTPAQPVSGSSFSRFGHVRLGHHPVRGDRGSARCTTSATHIWSICGSNAAPRQLCTGGDASSTNSSATSGVHQLRRTPMSWRRGMRRSRAA